MQTEQTQVDLFSDSGTTEALNNQEEVEQQALNLIPTGIIKAKSHLMIQMSQFYASNKTKTIRELSLNRLTEKNRTKEFPHVYEPINQIAAFESMRVPLVFKEDGCFEEIIRNTIMHFFPKCTIKKETSSEYNNSESFTLDLDSVPFRRFRYLERLIDEDSSWIPFLTNNLSEELRVNTEARAYENKIMNNYNRRFHVQKIRKDLEETSLSYDSIKISIPIESSFYFNNITSENLSVPGDLFDLLSDLISFSASYHFLSDSYKEINEMINAEFEKEKISYAEKQQVAYNTFQSEIHSRILPVEALTHKAALAMAEKKGMSHVFVPYVSEEPITTNKDIKLSVYVKNSNTSLQEWYVLPPSKEILDIPEMDYQGVLDYVKYDTTSYVAKKEKAYHVVGLETLLNTKIDEKMFMDMIVEEYKEHEMYQTIVDSLEILSQYPQTFRGISVSGYLASLPESTDEIELDDDTQEVDVANDWFESMQEESPTPTRRSSIKSNALSSLKTVVSETETPVVIKENSIVMFNPNTEVDFESYDGTLSQSYLNNTLFTVQSISFKEQDGESQLFFRLSCISSLDSETDFSEANFFDVTINEKELIFPDTQLLFEHYNRENFNTSIYSNIEHVKEMIISFASKEGLAWPVQDTSTAQEEETGGIDFDSLAIRNINSSHIYAVDLESKNLYVFKDKELIHTTSLCDINRDNVSVAATHYVDTHSSEQTGIQEHHGIFVLPIYSTTGGVYTHSVFN